MKISVIIPVFNAEKTIRKCVDSIINQTYKNIEIIIINDGSFDNTLNILLEYEQLDERIIIINNDNHGVSFSRNSGIDIATGDYITFVDCDDYLDLDCYEVLSKYLEVDYELIRYNFKIDGENGFNNNLFELSNKFIELNNNNKKNILKYFLLSSKSQIPNLVMLLLIKKELLQDLRFNEKLTMLEDVDFYYELFLKAKNIYFLDEKKYNYYVNPNSVTRDPKYFKKNIWGLLNTNRAIVKKSELSNNFEFIKEVNYNHLRIISEYLLKLYLSDKLEFKKMLDELYNNSIFKKLINHSRGYAKLKNKILIILLKLKNKLILNIYLNCLKFLYTFKLKIRKQL